MTEYTSNTTDVRELASSVITLDFPNDEVIEEQKAAFNHIAILTHKFDWSEEDDEYPSIQKIEARLAKCYIFDHYGGNRYREQVAYEEERLDKEIMAIKDNMNTVDVDEEDTLVRTDSKSWNLNADRPFQSKLNLALRADVMGATD